MLGGEHSKAQGKAVSSAPPEEPAGKREEQQMLCQGWMRLSQLPAPGAGPAAAGRFSRFRALPQVRGWN